MLFHYSKKYIFISSILTPCLFGTISTMVSAEELVLSDIEVRAERIQENNNASLNTSDSASLLSDEPGVTLYRAGGISSLPAIHGLADDRVRVKLDGMDLIASCPNHMNPPLSYIDPTNIDHIKVYAGITPVSVGGDSLGGTIMVNSAKPQFAAAGAGNLLKGQIGTFYRSNNNAQGGNISATFATESFNASYSGSTSKADNYEAGKNFKTTNVTGRTGHTLALDEVGSTAYETSNQTLGIAFKSGNHLVEAKFGYQNMPEQLYPNQRMDLLDNQQKRINLRYLGEFDWGALEARAYHETVDHYMDFGPDKKFFYTAGNTTQGMPMNTKGKTTGVLVKGDLKLSEQDVLRLGTEYQHYALQDWWPAVVGSMGMGPNDFININDGERERSAVFVEWEKRITADFTALAGLRYEQVKTSAGMVHGYNLASAPVSGLGGMMNQTRDAVAFNNSDRNKTDNNWDVTAMGRYVANPNTDLEFGVARKVRSPNLYERYTWSTADMMTIMNNTVGDGNGYFGDVNLKSEKAYTVSTTLDWHAANRDWELKATPYYTHVNDYIDAVQLTPATNAFTSLRYTNQSARLYGLDVTGHIPLAQTGAGLFALKALLNYTNGKNRDTGDDLYNIMPLNGKFTLTHNYQAWDSALELQMVKAKDHTSDARNEIKTAGYSLVNLRSSYNWKQARLDFGVENLFDKHYYLPLGGAYVGQGATMGMQNSPIGWGTAVPGMGRSINVGLTLTY